MGDHPDFLHASMSGQHFFNNRYQPGAFQFFHIALRGTAVSMQRPQNARDRSRHLSDWAKQRKGVPQ